MADLEQSGTGGEVAEAGGFDAVTFMVVVVELAAAGRRLATLGDTVRDTYRYVERCARDVDRLAEQMAGLAVDAATVAEHHEAAAVMRAALESAEEMASRMEDLSTLFAHASEAHRADYGPVADAAQHMTVPMADAQFYSNR